VTRGSQFFADAPAAAADSEQVRRLKRAGLVIFGRTNSCELGLSLTCEPALYGPTRTRGTRRVSPGDRAGARRRP
jgi:amidase